MEKGPSNDDFPDERGRVIDAYRLERLLARGSTGEVYLAKRVDDFEKRVALKLARPGGEAGERFLAKRRLLARLEHPAVARILDAGTTDDGRAYLVMEYVEGEPVDVFCRRRRLETRRRLELFRRACGAVAAAHRGLVVHGNLKPSHVLVTAGDGEVKLLDFGADARGASPPLEDVRALGTLLAELLADTRASGEPDLDAVVRRATDPRPERRYASVERLSEDVRRYLEGLPVEAREGSWVYRAGKLVRRQKWAAGLLGAVLCLGLVSGVLWRRAEQERDEAVHQRHRAERVSSFLEELFTEMPDDGKTSAVSLLDRGRARLGQDLGTLPEVRAELAGTLGTVYTRLGLYEAAREMLVEAVHSRRAHRADDHTELAVDINNLGNLAYRIGDHEAAERAFREALAMRQRLGQGEDQQAVMLANLAAIVGARGDHAEAEALYRKVLKIREELFGPEDPRVASILYSLGSLFHRRGDPAGAEPFLRRALDLRRRAHGPVHTRVATVESSLGRALFAQGRAEAARPFLARALETRRELLGDHHPHVALTRRDLGEWLLDAGEVEAAGEQLESALRILRRPGAAGEAALARTESVYGAWLAATGRDAEAEPYLERSRRTLGDLEGEASIYTRRAAERLETFYRDRGRTGDSSGSE